MQELFIPESFLISMLSCFFLTPIFFVHMNPWQEYPILTDSRLNLLHICTLSIGLHIVTQPPFYVFGEPAVHFFKFSPMSPLTEVSPQPSAIPGGNPPEDWQSAVGSGDAGFEPGTAGQQSGTLPLSHHASHWATMPHSEPSCLPLSHNASHEPPCLPNWATTPPHTTYII
jgi:hypothetical protein